MIFSDLNPHLALWESETYQSPTERRWLRWVRDVEWILGHSLDGNQSTDGYSLDFANDAFEAGTTPAEHAADVRDAIAAKVKP